ncbi:iron ABC transporter substrate-binding protein [Pelistega indica]|uniref:Iron ABC transporter substrate-binding protein n=1 Tax=Pelistega indica TaxID=1414851 RepID=V8GBL9_9BURK|nr:MULTISPECIES: ABC transporter substrate-binding protein [Pelistega]ETD73133.1 iron ABC transporter substrate-binding protein [Pelistega indica]
MKKILLASLLALASLGQVATAEVKTITDVLGREVKIDVPVKRPIISFYYPDYVAAVGVDNFKKVVGISREFWEKFNPGSWALFADKIPSLSNIADVGYVPSNTFAVEKVLTLKPDVLIMPAIQFNSLSNEIKQLEEAGIPIVVVDFNDQTIENHTKSIHLFGELNGVEERTNKIADEYVAGMNDIQTRVANAHLPKPKIYIEFGNKGPAEYSFTFGKNMWGAIAEHVGGDNISKPFVENWGNINPEQFLTSKPDVVIITGTEAGNKTNPDIMSMGIDISEEDAQHRLAKFITRAGWSDIPAVKNHRIFGMYHTASRSITDLASAQFMAKALYPEQFKDIDPNKTYIDFHKNYLPFVPKGTFFIQLAQ